MTLIKVFFVHLRLQKKQSRLASFLLSSASFGLVIYRTSLCYANQEGSVLSSIVPWNNKDIPAIASSYQKLKASCVIVKCNLLTDLSNNKHHFCFRNIKEQLFNNWLARGAVYLPNRRWWAMFSEKVMPPWGLEKLLVNARAERDCVQQFFWGRVFLTTTK